MKGYARKTIAIAATAFWASAFPLQAWALQIVPKCASQSFEYGVGQPPPPPQLTCFLEMMGNVALLILGLTGSLALFMFVYGGFMIVISAGDPSKVEKGKTIIRNAVIGIIIIMTSGIVLQYGLEQLGLKNDQAIIGRPCAFDASGAVTKVYKSQPDGKVVCSPVQ